MSSDDEMEVNSNRDEAENVQQGDALNNNDESSAKVFPDEERSPVFEVRVDRATELWESGKVKFRDSDIAGAMDDFERALYHVDFDELSYNFELMDIHRAAVDKVRVPLWLNVAACLLKQNNSKQAVQYCDKVLKQDPKHVKALYRRAKAREANGELETALKDMERAYENAKDDQEIAKALGVMKKRAQEAQKAADDLWRGKMKLPSPKIIPKVNSETEQTDQRRQQI